MVTKQQLWKPTKLGDVASFVTGKLNSNAARLEGAYPFFTCSQETFLVDTYSFDTEAVLLAGNNANGIYPIKYFQGKFDVYQRTYVIRTKDNARLTNHFLYYALQPKLELLRSISTGAATKFLTLTILSEIELALPPIDSQRKIAAILSAYDDLIENNTHRMKILEEMARMLYREWFVNFRFPGHEKVRMVKSPQGKVPEGWKVGELGTLAKKRILRFQEGQDDALPLLDLARIPRHSCAINDLGHSKEIKTSRIVFERGDILFGAIRPYFHKVVLAPFRGVTNTSVYVFAPQTDIPTSFLFSLLCSGEVVRWASQHSGGAKMPVIAWEVFTKMSVLIPPLDLLKTFDQNIAPVFRLIASLVIKNINLRRTRDLLLPKLISGEVDVSNLDIEVQ